MTVDDDGAIRAHQNLRDPPRGEAWTVAPADAKIGQLADPRPRLEATLREAGFFDLPPLTESPATQGGAIRTLSFTAADGTTRTVFPRTDLQAISWVESVRYLIGYRVLHGC